MKKLLLLSFCMFVMSCMVPLTGSGAYASSAVPLQVRDINVEKMNYANRDFTWFVVSCTVENQSDESGNVAVEIRTIDRWAYEKKPLLLTGYVKAGETKQLSVLDFMDGKMFDSLKKFEIKSVELD